MTKILVNNHNNCPKILRSRNRSDVLFPDGSLPRYLEELSNSRVTTAFWSSKIDSTKRF
ncbi:hypothetical protein K435DRAFT_773753 [Dendrothele bispora CBS 962.96]|uniref:Uncharacterized protein n=1 Tax=Dendrothele bispora (strain CBS 962.96) TaxID=1314807 RepID=A0A4S8LWL3_DENBC|nr:hypothetical protein K435DRAFT_779601 [Dendrothele bispora CBS 962.96]THV05609.1 hypothetical protein K435DRAFT_773753 [Dendrothele bispora CBS 962.96]